MSVGPSPRPLAALAASLPTGVRRGGFSAMGALQGIPLDQARRISADDCRAGAVTYPRGRPQFGQTWPATAEGSLPPSCSAARWTVGDAPSRRNCRWCRPARR